MDRTTTSSTEAHAHVSAAPHTLRRALALIREAAAREPRLNPLTGYSEMPGELSIRNLDLARRLGRRNEKTGRRIIAALRVLGVLDVRAVRLGRGRGGFMVLTLKEMERTFRVDIPEPAPRKMSTQVLVSDSEVSGTNKVSRRSTPTTTLLPETPKATPLTDEQREVVDHYFQRFQAKRGCEPPLPMKWALDLADKVARHGKVKALGVVDRFFDSGHPFITGGNYHVPALLWTWGELLSGEPVDKAEVERRRRVLISGGNLRDAKWAPDAQVNEAYEAWIKRAR